MLRALGLATPCAVAALLAVPVWAQAPAAAPEPAAPVPEASDRVVMSSGETLRGDIDRLWDEVLYFDSDDLDDLEIDWEDVAEIHTVRRYTYRFESVEDISFYQELMHPDRSQPLILVGVAQIDREEVRIEVEGEVLVFPREQLVAMVAGDETNEAKYWSGKLSIGASFRSGNVEQTDITGFASLNRTTAATRFKFDYSGAFGTVDDERSVDTDLAATSFDVYLTRLFYVRPIFVNFFRDPFKNIAWRVTPGAGLGYRLLDLEKVDADVDLGAGWQKTGFDSLPVCTPDGPVNELDLQDVIEFDACLRERNAPTSTGAVLAGLSFTSEPTSRIDFDGNYRFQMAVPDTRDIQHNLLLILSLELWRDLDLDLTFAWDRIENPAPDVDGVTPKPDDFRLSVGLGWNF